VRCIAQGRGRLEGNKEIMEWQWGNCTSVRIRERVSDDKLITTERFTMPDGKKREETAVLTRRKEAIEN
jgi:hypothetical protein